MQRSAKSKRSIAKKSLVPTADQLDAEACGRFSVAVADFVTAQQPFYPTLRKTAEQQRDQAALAWGVGSRTVDAYKNRERTNLPDGATFRRFCAAAQPDAPGVMAAQILYGVATPVSPTLAEAVAAYCNKQLDVDIAWRDCELRRTVNGSKALSLLVTMLRAVTPRAILIAPMMERFSATKAKSGHAKAHAELEAFARAVTGDDTSAAWAAFNE